MKRDEIIERFCRLSTLVMEKHFNYKIPADCFCGNYQEKLFQFDEQVIDFIEKSVDIVIEMERKLKS